MKNKNLKKILTSLFLSMLALSSSFYSAASNIPSQNVIAHVVYCQSFANNLNIQANVFKAKEFNIQKNKLQINTMNNESLVFLVNYCRIKVEKSMENEELIELRNKLEKNNGNIKSVIKCLRLRDMTFEHDYDTTKRDDDKGRNIFNVNTYIYENGALKFIDQNNNTINIYTNPICNIEEEK